MTSRVGANGTRFGVRRLTAAMVGVAGMALALAAPGIAAADGPSARIIGGHNATEAYPFITALYPENGNFGCGGALIRSDWVVTAAHCADNDPAPPTAVRIGSNDRTGGGTEAKVAKVVISPDYKGEDTPGGDIALLKLDHPVAQAPVPVAETSPAPGTRSRILGWGSTCEPSTGESCRQLPVNLQELDTVVSDDAACTNFDGATELCTGGDVPNAQACFGDSGGPQLVRGPNGWQLVGVTSRDGNGPQDQLCGNGTGIWTDTTSYRQWIDTTIAG